MSEESARQATSEEDAGTEHETALPERAGLARWQIASLVAASVIAIVGLCMMGVGAIAGGLDSAGDSPEPRSGTEAASPRESGDRSDGPPPDAVSGLGPDGQLGPGDLPGGFPGDDPRPPAEPPEDEPGGSGQPPANEVDRWLDTWSPAIFRLGFSFFVGFAVAYAVRGIIKLVVIFAGLLFLTLFVLQYAELVVVNWELMEQRYDELAAWIRREFSGVMSVARGYLPSAASGIGGLVVGFRRK